jgi:hypothetical protein
MQMHHPEMIVIYPLNRAKFAVEHLAHHFHYVRRVRTLPHTMNIMGHNILVRYVMRTHTLMMGLGHARRATRMTDMATVVIRHLHMRGLHRVQRPAMLVNM